MSNLIKYVQTKLSDMAADEGELLLAPKKASTAIVSAGGGGGTTIDRTPDKPGVSEIGDKLLLGYPVYHTGAGWTVGSSDRVLTAEPTSHQTTVGSAGSGKSAALVIPNALNYAAGPLVALDVKFEIALASAAYRRDVLGCPSSNALRHFAA